VLARAPRRATHTRAPTLAGHHRFRAHARPSSRRPLPTRQEEEEESAKRAKLSANMGIVVRKALTVGDRIERDYAADLRARVGTKTLVNADTQEGAGFLCKESGKVMRDSISYLDHINGKKRALRVTCA
jgi:hypothetical protein